ncbi:SDR family NAD(P)-dependent oxidoreductase, partial [Acinetobacter baumannii]|nr:SDR family NAD(P)-dependent oxidoreductase [Acinetobacter baumannii]
QNMQAKTPLVQCITNSVAANYTANVLLASGASPAMIDTVTKAGVRALSETLSAELRKFNIKVNVLCPTLVPTNIIKNG